MRIVPGEGTDQPADPAVAVDAVRNWYHTIELAPGVVTPGAFDLRPVVARLPWPDVRGKRCLDVGTYDGFLAFELERRGAAEVVAIDISDHEQWDWELHLRALGPEYLRQVVGPEHGAGFDVARALLGFGTRREELSVYELHPDVLGSFDVVVCGSLLLHLRDPLRALSAIRSVCRDWFMLTNQVEPALSLMHPRRAIVRLDGTSGMTQWWLPNRVGNRQMLLAAGFEIVRETGLYAVPFGPGHQAARPSLRQRARSLARRIVSGGDGVPHHAVLARPRALGLENRASVADAALGEREQPQGVGREVGRGNVCARRAATPAPPAVPAQREQVRPGGGKR